MGAQREHEGAAVSPCSETTRHHLAERLAPVGGGRCSSITLIFHSLCIRAERGARDRGLESHESLTLVQGITITQ